MNMTHASPLLMDNTATAVDEKERFAPFACLGMSNNYSHTVAVAGTHPFTVVTSLQWIHVSIDNVEFTDLDTRTNIDFTNRLHTLTFSVASPKFFSTYRLSVTLHESDSVGMQLTEVVYFAPARQVSTTNRWTP
jgi:hypothetical protein